MNAISKPSFVAFTTSGILCACLTAAAAPMPKEGSFELNFCFVTDIHHIAVTDKTGVGYFTNSAALHSLQPGGAFDLQGARCFGYYSNVEGQYGDHGYCELIDADGDRWIMKFQSGPDQSGTWNVAAGTRKYVGMTATGAYKPLGFVSSPEPGRAQRCNRNTGTYKLK